MKKLLVSTLAISAVLFVPTLRADDVTDDSGTPVGQASSEGSHSARSKTWQNVGIAAGAVAIAVTALVLVSNNNGHHHNHGHAHSHSH